MRSHLLQALHRDDLQGLTNAERHFGHHICGGINIRNSEQKMKKGKQSRALE